MGFFADAGPVQIFVSGHVSCRLCLVAAATVLQCCTLQRLSTHAAASGILAYIRVV
jgi:hypothetical protein